MPHTGATNERMRRVLVIGCAGAGKTTFSHQLGTVLALPVVNLDRYFWRPQWQLPDMREWRETVMELAAAPEWIMDGNYSSTFDIRMPRADTVIWLDLPRHVCMSRVLVRTLKGYVRTRPDAPEGCPDRIDLGFFRFVWDFHSKHRPRILEGIRTYGRNIRLFQFSADGEAEQFLSRVGSS